MTARAWTIFHATTKRSKKPKFDMSSGRITPLQYRVKKNLKVNPSSVGTCECAHVSKRINRREMIYLALGQRQRQRVNIQCNPSSKFQFAPKSNLNCFQNCTGARFRASCCFIDGHLLVPRGCKSCISSKIYLFFVVPTALFIQKIHTAIFIVFL